MQNIMLFYAKNSAVLHIKLQNNSYQSMVIGKGAAVGFETVTREGNVITNATGGAGATNVIAFGTSATVGSASHNAIAMGYSATVGSNAANAAAIGSNARATAPSALAIGVGALANFANSMALGVNSRTDYTAADYATKPWAAKGAISTPTSTKTGIISVGSKGQERRITNVASGALDTDAVNVSQLRTIDEKFETAIAQLSNGGGVQYLSIERKNEAGQAGQLTASLEKTETYQKYVNMKTELQFLEARKQVNNEQFDDTAFNEYKAKVEEYGNKFNGAVATTASALSGITDQIEQAKATLAGMEEGEAKETKRQELIEQLKTAIANAKTADAQKTMAGSLSADAA